MGFYGGNPRTILKEPVDIIMDLLNYLSFKNEYEDMFMEINKGDRT